MSYRANKLLSYVILIVALLLNGTANSQPYYFRHYQVESGLSNNTVYCSAQDRKGFMWFGTKDGLNRFDGVHFKVFYLNNEWLERSADADYIHSLFASDDGNLWVGAERGLYRFNTEKERLEPFIDTLRDISSIQPDKNGRLWFLSGSEICHYDFKSKRLKRFAPNEYFHATSICLSPDGVIWAATTTGFLQKYNEANGQFTAYDVFAHSPLPASRWIQKITAGINHRIYIGTSSQGFKCFDISKSDYQDILIYNQNKTTIFVRDILQNTEDEVWFATESGIFIFNTINSSLTNLKKRFSDPYSLNDNAVYTLCLDAEGSIWAGTYFGGINYYSKQNVVFKKYFPDNTANSISGNAVREICEDRYGNLWIGTEDNGLNKIDKRTGAYAHFRPTGEKTSIAYTNIHGLLANGDELWIGTFEHGIDVMDLKTGMIKKHFISGPGEDDLKSNFILCFLRVTTGDIYIGTTRGLYRYTPGKDGFERPSQIPGNLFISSIMEDHNHTIWIGTHDHRGVFWFNPFTGTSGRMAGGSQQKNGLRDKTINDIYEDSDHNIWFATEGGGICKLDNNRKHLAWYTTKDGLPGDFIFKILEDRKKNLWISTSRGLIRFNPANQGLETYTQANGLLNDQFNYHSGFKDSSGRLYFGSVRGMISFRPEDILVPSFVPPLYITGLQVYNRELTVAHDSSQLKKSIIVTDRIELPYNQSTISIDFAALSYISPKMITYSYRLKNLDDDWTTIKANRKVYFTNLPPGRYVFELKAATNNVWTANVKQLTIDILPPFWLTRWAIIFYVLFAIFLAYYLFRNYHERQQSKKQKEIYKSKIEFFTTVAHEIRTPLTLIKGPVENLLEKEYAIPNMKEDIACLNRNTNRLMDLASQILDFQQTEIKGFSLDFTKVNINEILNETYLSFKIMAQKRNLDYNIICPPSVIYTFADAEALQKIFSNLIGNAVKYAKTSVLINLHPASKNTEVFTIDFENDGYLIPKDLEEKLFEPFFRLKETSQQKGFGIGLTLARSLARLHNGNLSLSFVKKEVNTFTLFLPLKRKPTSAAEANLESKTKRK